MATVILTASADADLAGIVDELARKAGVTTAERYAAELDALFDRLADFPETGPPRQRLGPHVRIGIVAPYLAIYEYEGDVVTILRVLHGRRKITRRVIRSE